MDTNSDDTMSDQSPINHTKKNFKIFLPNLFLLTEVDPAFPWDRIDRLYTHSWQEKSAGAAAEVFSVEKPSFFFVFMAALKGTVVPIGYLDFLNRLFKDLAVRLIPPQKVMLVDILKKLLETPSLEFRNFMAELGVLNNLLRTDLYELVCVESPLENDCSIDFELKTKATGELQFVEVESIVLNDEKVEPDPAKIEKFIAHRAKQKRAKKTQGLKERKDFTLVFVLWGTDESLQIYKNHYALHPMSIPNVLEPLAYLQKPGGNGFYRHFFGRVSKSGFNESTPDTLSTI